MQAEEKLKKLVETLKQQKIILADDMLRVKGHAAIWEKKLEDSKRLTDEIAGRILQIEETLQLLGEGRQKNNIQTGDKK